MDFNNIDFDPSKLFNFSKLSTLELLERETRLDYHDFELYAVICDRAGLEKEWADADSETFEGVLDRAIGILTEDIWNTCTKVALNYRMKRFVNLTPHTLNIIKADGSTIDIQPSGNIARVSSSSTIVATLKGINVSQQTFGDVIDLPDTKNGIIYIVSRMVKDRVPDRPDVLVPGAPVRDAEGKIIGANGLSL